MKNELDDGNSNYFSDLNSRESAVKFLDISLLAKRTYLILANKGKT